MSRSFTSQNYKVVDLLHLGRDHFYCGIYFLYEGTPRAVQDGEEEIMVDVFDSGGYLIHLGIELLLKAILLNEKGAFENDHILKKISSKITSVSFLNHQKVLNEIDRYYFSRYGKDTKNQPVEIGNENIKDYCFFKFILKNMPSDLRKQYQQLDPYRKAGTVLMQKPLST